MKSNGELVIKRYLRERLLGKGGFAKCYLLTDMENSNKYAVKIVSKLTLVKNKARQKVYCIVFLVS